MKKPQRLLIIFFLIIASSSFSQKLKKADRVIAENIQAHVNYLSDDRLKGRIAGTDGEHIADEYIITHFKKSGCKPMGDSSYWIQKFMIADGKEIVNTSHLSINGKELALHTDYFPFAFSASKKAEANVAMELAETGVPWFIDLKELMDNGDTAKTKDTSALIVMRAARAASKGATALIVYNNSAIQDLGYNPMAPFETAKIPVVYIMGNAAKKHLQKESASLDVKMNISLKDRFRNGCNVLGYADNAADSTVVATAHLDNERDVAALIELSRLLRNKQFRSSNYLFVVYSGEKKGADGINYFNNHPVFNLQKVNYTLNLDTMQDKGLPAVKKSIAAINALRTHETKTRP
ncbi:MAG: hypothetical protein H0X41_03215 [Chitinophagaceae bacterium]|nr:hypothetical protein [Chitinophagaceae bacterium]